MQQVDNAKSEELELKEKSEEIEKAEANIEDGGNLKMPPNLISKS